MEDKNCRAEDTEHLHCGNSRKDLGDHASIQISTDLHTEHQKLRKAYQNLKQERDMLLKALNAYHKSLSMKHAVSDKNL